MEKTKVTLKIVSKVYACYKKFCKQNGFTIGKRIENFMLEDLENPLNFVRPKPSFARLGPAKRRVSLGKIKRVI